MPDITYVGRENDTDVFHVLADGDSDGANRRPVLKVLVDDTDRIWVAAIGESLPILTRGEAHRHMDEELERSGIDTRYVCLGSVVAYVGPRIVTLMARVYCPRVDVT